MLDFDAAASLTNETLAFAGGLNLPFDVKELVTNSTIKLKDYPSITASKYASVAGLVVFLYDIFLTLPDEVKYLWFAPNSSVRTFYFINRYMAIPFLILSNFLYSGVRHDLTDEFCWGSTAAIGVAQEVGMVAGKLIMLLRVMALYSNGRLVSFSMILLLLICWAGSGASLALSLFDIHSGPQEIQWHTVANICLMKRQAKALIGIPSLIVFDTVVVILTAIKAIEHSRGGKTLGRDGILFTLWSDGVGYFFIVAASHCVAILVWTRRICPANMFFLGLYLQWAISAAITARLVLRLREANDRVHRQSAGKAFSTTAAGSEMVFGKGYGGGVSTGYTKDTGSTVTTFVDWRTEGTYSPGVISPHGQEQDRWAQRDDGYGRVYGAGGWR